MKTIQTDTLLRKNVGCNMFNKVIYINMYTTVMGMY